MWRVQPSKFCPNCFAQAALYSLELLLRVATMMSAVTVMLVRASAPAALQFRVCEEAVERDGQRL